MAEWLERSSTLYLPHIILQWSLRGGHADFKVRVEEGKGGTIQSRIAQVLFAYRITPQMTTGVHCPLHYCGEETQI